MQNVKITTFCLLLTAAVLAALCLAGCGDKPAEPKPVKDYVFYFNDGGYYDRYYRYFSATGKIDSLSIPYDSRVNGIGEFVLSSDGTRLYLPDGAKTVVISTDSFEVITVLNYSSVTVAVSPDNRLVAIQGMDGLYILNTSDYSLLYHDTTQVARGVFSDDSRSFYATRWMAGVYQVDLYDTLFTVTTKSFPYTIGKIVPSHNEDKWFLLVRYDECLWSFEVYETSLDSIIFRDSLFEYGYGDMVLTPDGRFLFYTMPGTQLEYCIAAPHSAFTVFDVHRNAIDAIISTAGIGITNGFFPVGDLAITPDGNKLIAVRGPVGGEFIVLDVRTMEIEKYCDLGNVWLFDVTCQNGL